MRGLYLLRIDGGKKASLAGEPAKGAFGFILRDPKDREVEGWFGKGVIDTVRSPHSAEYEALLAGLEFALNNKVDYLAVFSDSRTVVNQVNGPWKSSGDLVDYCAKARQALNEFAGWQLSWVPREWNKEADALVEEAFSAKDEIEHSTD
jgi:ribonuclease HI